MYYYYTNYILILVLYCASRPLVIIGISYVYPEVYSTETVLVGLPEEQKFRVRPQSVVETYAGDNESIQLNCEVDNQGGIVQWTRNGFVLMGNRSHLNGYPNYKIVGDIQLGQHNLVISPVHHNDAGDYECQVGPYLLHDPPHHFKSIRASSKLIIKQAPRPTPPSTPPPRPPSPPPLSPSIYSRDDHDIRSPVTKDSQQQSSTTKTKYRNHQQTATLTYHMYLERHTNIQGVVLTTRYPKISYVNEQSDGYVFMNGFYLFSPTTPIMTQVFIILTIMFGLILTSAHIYIVCVVRPRNRLIAADYGRV